MPTQPAHGDTPAVPGGDVPVYCFVRDVEALTAG